MHGLKQMTGQDPPSRWLNSSSMKMIPLLMLTGWRAVFGQDSKSFCKVADHQWQKNS